MLAKHCKYSMLIYKNLHQITNRCTSEMYYNYKLALLLHKTYNTCAQEKEWTELNFVQTLMSGQIFFHVIKKSNNNPIGMNTLCNRFFHIYDKIPLDWLNKTLLSFEIECKHKFMYF
jgi:hypothetical protein